MHSRQFSKKGPGRYHAQGRGGKRHGYPKKLITHDADGNAVPTVRATDALASGNPARVRAMRERLDVLGVKP